MTSLADRVGRALDEGRDLRHVIRGELAFEIWHSALGKRIAEQNTVEFLNGLCARKPQIRQVSAIVDTGDTVAEQ